jgi:hypothetical protein
MCILTPIRETVRQLREKSTGSSIPTTRFQTIR